MVFAMLQERRDAAQGGRIVRIVHHRIVLSSTRCPQLLAPAALP